MTAPGMLPRQAAAAVAQALKAAGCPDAVYDARFLVQLVTGQDPRLSDAPLTGVQTARLNELAARRAAREPLQYLCGCWPFFDFELVVGPGVLCPRADTEIVAEAAAALLQGTTDPRVLDLCAGTGCLGLGVKRLCPSVQLTALEKSPDALVYLRQNAAHALDGRGLAAPYAQVVQGDLFEFYKELPESSFDLIVSNPPYLTAQEMTQLQPEVAHEPAMALAAGPDGLDFYRAIAAHYQQALRPGGALVLEIGWQQREVVTTLLQQNGWTRIECRQDYAGLDRCITARRPG
ncbi:MAG: peptide chain release factor N(5)-glutamine methyltransferase [Faecalibacterium sp.]|nr:peptide chain release factor N(5)-glutamine methyltransferase [Faecalibacterium sp.]